MVSMLCVCVCVSYYLSVQDNCLLTSLPVCVYHALAVRYNAICSYLCVHSQSGSAAAAAAAADMIKTKYFSYSNRPLEIL